MQSEIKKQGYDIFEYLKQGITQSGTSNSKYRKNLEIEIDKQGIQVSLRAIEDDLVKFIQT